MVVLAVLGLLLALVLYRAPARNPTVELRAAAGSVASTLRLARTQAIVDNRMVVFTLDPAAHGYRLDGNQPQQLPDLVGVAIGATGSTPAIRFAPDGSASGGVVTLATGDRRMRVTVDWLTGRVSVGDAG